MEITYKKIEFGKSPEDLITHCLNQVLELSLEWEREKCSTAYTANLKEYYVDKELFVAIDNHQVIGYALGEIKSLSEETSYNMIGEKVFELDELFVSKSYRCQKIGQGLFSYMEDAMKSQVDLIGVIANSLNYQRLLRFYADGLNMNFKEALFIKRV